MFTLRLRLAPGSYRYAYIVDGERIPLMESSSWLWPLPSGYGLAPDGGQAARLDLRGAIQSRAEPLIDHETKPAWYLKRLTRNYRDRYRVFAKENSLKIQRGSDYRQVLSIPLPSSNMYHEVGPIKASRGKVEFFQGSGNRYLRVESAKPIDEVVVEYDIRLWESAVDWSLVGTPLPYDTSKQMYWDYVGFSSRTIDPEHPTIARAADEIWSGSSGVIDYARRALRWVIEQNKTNLVNSYVDYSSLDDVFSKGVRDCAASSGILISLLRRKGIPARQLNGILVDDAGSFMNTHVWVEAYLEGYGWFPMDPSIVAEPGREYFGFDDGRRIFFNRGMNASYQGARFVSRLTTLQVPHFTHWIYKGRLDGDYDIGTEIQIKRVSTPDKAAWFNDPARRAAFTKSLAAFINKQRAAAGLSLVRVDEGLTISAQALLASQFGPQEDKLDSDRHMKASHPGISSFGARWFSFDGPELDLSLRAYSNIEKYALDPAWKAIGIGYHYDPKEGLHNAWIYYAR